MSAVLERPAVCPHCGTPVAAKPEPRPAPALAADPNRYDLEPLVAEAAQEKAYDETTRVRVTQQDIRNLLEKRRKGRK